MSNLPKRVPTPQLSLPACVTRQLSISFETVPIRGLLPAERRKIIAHMANILLQAAGAAAKDGDDDEH